MLDESSTIGDVDGLARRISRASASTGELFEMLATSSRVVSLKQMGRTRHLRELIQSRAWTEAALELLALEAPTWQLKRLWLDEGEWLCTLTRFPALPEWLDDAAEARHPVMALAILGALIDVRSRASVP